MELRPVETTSKTLVGPSASVSVSVYGGAVSIVFQHRRGSPIDGSAATLALSEAFELCMNRDEGISVVFLWAMGPTDNSAAKGSYMTDLHSLPGLDEKAPGGARIDIPQGGFDTLWQVIDAFPYPVIGLGGGKISGTGTRLLASCDLVIANRSAEFLPNLLTNVDIDTAWATGFVSYVLDDTIALLQECERLRDMFASKSRSALKAVKQDLRTSRVSRLGNKGSDGSSGVSTCSTPPSPDEAQVPLPPSPSFLAQGWKHPYAVEPTSAMPLAYGDVCLEKVSVSAVAAQVDSQAKQGHRAAARKRNLASKFDSYDGPITTLMLSNLPCRVTQAQMVIILDQLGFGDAYDLLYLPVGKPGKPASKSGTSNLGYGFVNFADPNEAAEFADAFQAYNFEGTNSTKTCTVRPAHIQGLASFLHHFQRNVRKHLPPGPLVHFGGSLKEVTA